MEKKLIFIYISYLLHIRTKTVAATRAKLHIYGLGFNLSHTSSHIEKIYFKYYKKYTNPRLKLLITKITLPSVIV